MKELYASRIPAALLLEVTEIATVYSAKVAKSKDLVMLTSTSGTTKNLTKAEFVAQKFCTISGKEVRLISMKADVEYIVYHIVNRHSFAVKIPRGNKSVLHLENESNTDMTAGKVLVVDESKLIMNEDGTFNLTSGHVMSEAIFRKTCILRSVSKELLAQIQNKPIEEIEQPDKSFTNLRQPVEQPTQQPIQQPQSTAQSVTTQPAQEETKAVRGRVVALGKDRADRLVCYFVYANESMYQYTPEQLMELCEQNLIANATVVHERGKRYLRGVGCRLEELRIKLVE